MAEYDIGKAFGRVENELMESMIRNMRRHRIEEADEKKEWAMWQVEQLRYLEEYRRRNKERYNGQFRDINGQIGALISAAHSEGGMKQEIEILRAIKKGFKAPGTRKGSVLTTGEFFRLNERKLEALIKATQNDLDKAERALLRMADDQYRRVIFDAQMYANMGAGTYEKAVDMATKDFLSRGLNCIEYKNGARHTIKEYADMAIRTASKRAYLMGEGEMRQQWGIHTVIMNKRGNACPKCLPFVGKVLIDDVWSGGKQSDGPYMLMSDAMAAGLYHPRCKDIHTTYFEGISAPGAIYTKEELELVEEAYKREQQGQYAKRQEERFRRLGSYSLDKDHQSMYLTKWQEWKEREESKTKVEYESTTINRQLVDSNNYRNRIDSIDEDVKVKRSIWKKAVEMLYHRSGTQFEDLAFIDSKTGRAYINKSYNEARKAKPNKRMRKMLRESDDYSIIGIHNHPNSSVPSISDIRAAKERKYKYGMVVCHDGNIYKYSVNGDRYIEPIVVSALARLQQYGYNEKVGKMFLDAGVVMEVL